MLKPKLLIVEDEILIALGFQNRLQSKGYDVCEIVSDGDKVIVTVEKENPDIILMDINIQGKRDGVEIAKEIKSRFNTPIVFLSGYFDPETKKRINTVNHSGFLEKPVDISVLDQAFQKALKK